MQETGLWWDPADSEKEWKTHFFPAHEDKQNAVVVPDTKRRLTSETLYPGPVSSNSTPDKVVPYTKNKDEDQLRPLTKKFYTKKIWEILARYCSYIGIHYWTMQL